jgi:hypothetical protein
MELKNGGFKLRKWNMKMAISALALSLVLPLSAQAAGSFSDVGPRFEKEINYLAERNLVKGYSNGTFRVNAPITRAEAVTIIVRELPVSYEGAPDPGFTDFKQGDGFYTSVAQAVEYGFIQGKIAKDGSRYFDPNGSLTRSEMAIILTKAYDIPLDRFDVRYKDVSPGMPSNKAISALAHGGISYGYEDWTYKPYASITRQEFAAFFARTLNKEFNRMSLEFVQYDEVTHQRVKTVWLAEDELNKKSEELVNLINEARAKKGLSALKLNDRLSEMASIKTRIFAKYPSEYSDKIYPYEDFYEYLYGEKVIGEMQERFTFGSVEDAFSSVSVKAINETYMYEPEQKEIGIGMAQLINGSYQWLVIVKY